MSTTTLDTEPDQHQIRNLYRALERGWNLDLAAKAGGVTPAYAKALAGEAGYPNRDKVYRHRVMWQQAIEEAARGPRALDGATSATEDEDPAEQTRPPRDDLPGRALAVLRPGEDDLHLDLILARMRAAYPGEYDDVKIQTFGRLFIEWGAPCVNRLRARADLGGQKVKRAALTREALNAAPLEAPERKAKPDDSTDDVAPEATAPVPPAPEPEPEPGPEPTVEPETPPEPQRPDHLSVARLELQALILGHYDAGTITRIRNGQLTVAAAIAATVPVLGRNHAKRRPTCDTCVEALERLQEDED